MNKKITIGMFDDSYFPVVDGVAMVIDNYARRLLKYANVVVFVPEIPGQDWDDSIYPYKVVRCKSLKIPFCDYSCPTPEITRNFKKKIDECNLDIVHIHSPFTIGMYALRYAKRHKLPVVSTFHTQFDLNFMRLTKSKKVSEQIIKAIMRVFNKSNEVWTVNKEMARILCEDYKYRGKEPIIINNSTEMTRLKDVNKARKEINKLHNLNNSERVFLFVGRINKVKNILFIVDTLKILKNNDFKFKMLFVGTGQDEKMLLNYIKDNNLQEDVIMCGKVTDRNLLRNYYARADLFLFPSLYDTNSLVQIEAASQATPTVFLYSPTSSTVTNMVNGFITKENVLEYADMIMNVMKDKKLYKKVSENAYKDLYKNWDDLVDEIYRRYVKLIEEKR
jgi:glycosyltransferase involved in cell wall biosynthesis